MPERFGLYRYKEIKPKKSLKEITVARGTSKELFRPDYVIVCFGKPRWLIDAKSTDEDIEKWTYQGAGYALGLNQQYSAENPCDFYVITNGLVFKVYRWDESPPILSLTFSDFQEDNPHFFALRSLLGAKTVRQQSTVAKKTSIRQSTMLLKKPSVEETKRIFKNCHRLIWKTEKMNPQPAFFEFVKIMFLKLLEDRRLHDDTLLGNLVRSGQPIPKDRVIFSTWWIDSLQENGVENPMDTILFKKLLARLKEEVAKGEKKPIFEDNEHLIQVGTIKQVVAKLEHYDMFSVDEDLNGRLFETFLSAVMRGSALGQYFTPRSVVRLMERLVSPIASRERIDRVLDACCGTGGFLIEVLTDMRNQLRSNKSLTTEEFSKLQEEVANQSIFGIDAGSDPPIARIARINMYLHGDGGSRIYAADKFG